MLFLAWVAVSSVIVSYAIYSATERARDAIFREAGETLAVQSETLSGVLDKYRLMAPLLARQSSVASLFVLDAEDNPQAVAARRMASSLTGMSAARDVAFFFPDGRLLGHNQSEFVRRRTGIDDLIATASEGRLGRALLSLSPEERSYAFSSGVRRNGKLVGIVIVYVDFYRVETAWALSNKPIFVTDKTGTIVLANVAEWRMRNFSDLANRDGEHFVARQEGEVQHFLNLQRSLPVLDWTLHVFSEPAPIFSARISAGAIATLSCLLVGLIALFVLQRSETVVLRQRADRATALRLERIVRDRTRALSRSNNSLSHEVEVRRETEARLRATQAELIQAAKLAALGQMSAAISHEYNQPLAAIRSYADNGLKFLERGRNHQATENLGRINMLVDRMAELSRTLLSFARKPGQTTGPVRLGPIIEEALLLSRPRARNAGVEIQLLGDYETAEVAGGRIRLGQVFVNLVNNAVDALGGQENGLIEIIVTDGGEKVIIEIADNGPGISESEIKQIFDPFFTTKPTGEGIGIGLSIVDNILRDFGGKISVGNRAEGGACFRVELEPAKAAANTQTGISEAAGA